LTLLRVLDGRGVFTVRHAVPRIADRLGVSRSAVYADLSDSRKQTSDGRGPAGTEEKP
jgi:predicted transcriptional regulator YheO